MESIVILNFNYMVVEIVKIVAPLLIAAVVRALEKRKLRRQGKLRDEKYYDNELSDMFK